MNPDEQHVALPKLYGAPAYARPPRIFDTIDRPTDPDDLPLEAFRDEGFDLSSSSPLTADAGSGGAELSLASDDP
ncbi:MAG TPA: hypothetical protein VEY67_02895, partial [Candidatus Dormibacteraeota bacterium]|nr:hypothetical protein [Candidatus Dormibacteraeota bacterium]